MEQVQASAAKLERGLAVLTTLVLGALEEHAPGTTGRQDIEALSPESLDDLLRALAIILPALPFMQRDCLKILAERDPMAGLQAAVEALVALTVDPEAN